jgi:DNA-binding transcriptional regulator YhcF (GntR family)
MENGYSFCLNKWLFDKEIKDELALLIAISSLSAQYGYCFATNDYLAKEFETNTTTISRKLKKLEDKGYLKIEYKRNGNVITERKIYINELYAVIKNDNGPLSKMITAVIKNDKDNNITTNKINNNIERYIEEIEQFKPVLNSSDYEIIKKIASKYSLEQVKQALAISKQNNAYSIKYLLQVLVNGIKEKSPIKSPSKIAPNWLNEDIQTTPMNEEELLELQKEFEKILQNN